MHYCKNHFMIHKYLVIVPIFYVNYFNKAGSKAILICSWHSCQFLMNPVIFKWDQKQFVWNSNYFSLYDIFGSIPLSLVQWSHCEGNDTHMNTPVLLPCNAQISQHLNLVTCSQFPCNGWQCPWLVGAPRTDGEDLPHCPTPNGGRTQFTRQTENRVGSRKSL